MHGGIRILRIHRRRHGTRLRDECLAGIASVRWQRGCSRGPVGSRLTGIHVGNAGGEEFLDQGFVGLCTQRRKLRRRIMDRHDFVVVADLRIRHLDCSRTGTGTVLRLDRDRDHAVHARRLRVQLRRLLFQLFAQFIGGRRRRHRAFGPTRAGEHVIEVEEVKLRRRIIDIGELAGGIKIAAVEGALQRLGQPIRRRCGMAAGTRGKQRGNSDR